MWWWIGGYVAVGSLFSGLAIYCYEKSVRKEGEPSHNTPQAALFMAAFWPLFAAATPVLIAKEYATALAKSKREKGTDATTDSNP
jgi:ABC-type Co2+ transport system permease subunit